MKRKGFLSFLVALLMFVIGAITINATVPEIKVKNYNLAYSYSDSTTADGQKDSVVFVFQFDEKVDIAVQHYSTSTDSVITIYSALRSELANFNSYGTFYTLDTLETTGSVFKDTVNYSKRLLYIIHGLDTSFNKVVVKALKRQN